MSAHLRETCTCGATFDATADYMSTLNNAANMWREEHKHAESVGICGDMAPMVIPDGSDMAPLVCDLKAGHAGAHGNRDGSWMRPEQPGQAKRIRIPIARRRA